MARGSGGRRGDRLSPFATGILALVVTVVACYFAFSQANPFAKPYEVSGVFDNAANIKPRAAVRVAGIDVGKVTKIDALENGKARVTMQIQDKGRPLHQDAEFKIRPRIFLEGNVFVDIQPGSPSAPELDNGAVIPPQQTASPVQFEQVLSVLQSDTRDDLKSLLREFAKGWEGGGAEAFNRSAKWWTPAYKYSSLANEATLGEEPHDFSKLMRGQAKTFRALADDEEALKDLVTDFNTFAGALAREDVALEAAIPALRDVVVDGRPALAALNGALPSLRAFSRDALPGTKSSLPTINASLPFIKQARGLMARSELRGLANDLRSAIPSMAKLNAVTLPFLAESRALSSCTSKTLVPWATKPIPDPGTGNTGQPFYKQAGRGLVGLSGESRLNDANTPFFRVQQGGGPHHVVSRDEAGNKFVSLGGSLFAAEAVRPIRLDQRPKFRPDVPCETQEVPDLNAGTGPADTSMKANPTAMTPALRKLQADGLRDLGRVEESILRNRKGLPAVDPLALNDAGERAKLKRLGLKWDKNNKLVKAGSK
jgi:virulence factor Mce-like protein